jgi:hypothetical protein
LLGGRLFLQAGVDELEDVGFRAGIILFEALEVFVGLEGVALAAADVAEKDVAAGEPILVGRV